MNKPNYDIEDLLRKYHTGHISKEEFARLKAAVNRSTDEEMKDFMARHWDSFARSEEIPALSEPGTEDTCSPIYPPADTLGSNRRMPLARTQYRHVGIALHATSRITAAHFTQCCYPFR